MKVEVAVLGTPSLIVLMISVDVSNIELTWLIFRAQKLWERRSGRPRLRIPNSPHGLALWT